MRARSELWVRRGRADPNDARSRLAAGERDGVANDSATTGYVFDSCAACANSVAV